MFKEFHFRHPKFAFLKLDIQLVFSQPLEHFPEMLHTFLHGDVVEQNLIYVYDYKIIKPLLENVVHDYAKHGECIGEPKRHHQELV
jgi:hypothetical protein